MEDVMSRPGSHLAIQLKGPRMGDVLLRGDGHLGFELVTAVTHEPIETEIPSLEAVVEVAPIPRCNDHLAAVF